MSYSWTAPTYLFYDQAITGTGYIQSGTVQLDNTYTSHFVAFSTGGEPGLSFTLTLYGFLPGETPGGIPYTMGSFDSSTVHNTSSGSWTSGYSNVGYISVQGIPAAYLYADINVTSFSDELGINVSVVSSN